MRIIVRGLMVTAFLLSVIVMAQAEPITVVNPGFELPELNDGEFTNNEILGWTGTNSDEQNNFGVFNPSTSFFPNEAAERFNVAYIERGEVFQIVNAVLTANTEYTLTVRVGNSLVDTLPGYAVQLRAGGNVLAESTIPVFDDGTFTTVTAMFTARENDPLLGEDLEIRLIEVDVDKISEAYFDDVLLDATSVEPPPPPCVESALAHDFIQPSSGDFFVASANGVQQVTDPPGGADTNATCLGTFRVVGDESSPTLRYRVQCFGIIGVTQAHIHLAGAQRTGDIVASLFPLGDPTGAVDGIIRRSCRPGLPTDEVSQGVLTDADLQGDLSGMTITELVDIMHADGAYLNVHTEDNLTGEARGQILPVENVRGVVEEFYFANGSGSQVFTGTIDGVSTDATCTASFRPSDAERMKYKVRCNGINGVTEVTMHIGSPQENGGVVAVLFPEGEPTEAVTGVIRRDTEKSKGTLTDADVAGTTVSGLIDTMRAGNTYFNVLTETHPDGEVRGQIVRMDMLGGGF